MKYKIIVIRKRDPHSVYDYTKCTAALRLWAKLIMIKYIAKTQYFQLNETNRHGF